MLREAHKYTNDAQFVLDMHLAQMVRFSTTAKFSLRAFFMIVLIRSLKDFKTFAKEPVLFQRVSIADVFIGICIL